VTVQNLHLVERRGVIFPDESRTMRGRLYRTGRLGHRNA
jgi:hypothetical protein